MKTLNVFRVNFSKELIEMKRYLPNTLAYLFTYYIIFLGLFFGITSIGNPLTVDTTIQFTIVGTVFWALAMMIMNFMGYAIITEATRGTLEQMYMSPTPVWVILLTRIISQSVLQIIIMIILLFAAMATSGQWLNLNPVTILPLLLITIISMSGVSFIIAGLAIIVKQIQAFLQIFQFVLMALVFIPIQSPIILLLTPFVQGVTMIRKVMLDGYTLLQFTTTDYLILGANAVIYLVLGLVTFKWCENVAIKKGLLGQY